MSQIILKQNLDFLTKGLDFTASFSYDVNTVSIQSRGKYSSLYAVNGVDDETGLYSLVPKREGDEFLGYSYSNTATVPTSSRRSSTTSASSTSGTA